MKIFISYRRDDSAGYAGRLFDYLSTHFGHENVFMDIDTIQPGEDFRKVVKNAVGSCDVVLVIIGKLWLTMTDPQGQRRLDDPRDWVRVEISSALIHPSVRVIPVLVRGAAMPAESELPDDLKELCWRNALELSDSRFQHDANKLIDVIERLSKEKPGAKPALQSQKKNGKRVLPVVFALFGLGLILAAALYGIRNSGAFQFSPPIVVPSSTDTPEPTTAPTDRVLPTMTFNPPPTAAIPATETLIPTPTTVPIPPAADAVKYYYSMVSADFLDTTWNLLTERYKANHNASGFVPYQEYWSRVDNVSLANISTLYDDGKNATITVDLITYYWDTRVISTPGYQIQLVYDPSRQTWLIDETR